MTDRTTSPLTIVAYGCGQGDTAVAVSLLRAADIEVHAHSAHLSGVVWQWTHALGGVRLYVPLSQEEAAREVLAGLDERVPRRLNLWFAVAAALVLFWTGVPPPASGLVLTKGARALRSEALPQNP